MKILQRGQEFFIGPLEIVYTEDTKRFIITSLEEKRNEEYFTLWRHPETVKSKLKEGLSSGDKVVNRKFWISGSIVGDNKNKPIRTIDIIKTPLVKMNYRLWEDEEVLLETSNWVYSFEIRENINFSMKTEDISDLKSLVFNQLEYLLNYHKEIS